MPVITVRITPTRRARLAAVHNRRFLFHRPRCNAENQRLLFITWNRTGSRIATPIIWCQGRGNSLKAKRKINIPSIIVLRIIRRFIRVYLLFVFHMVDESGFVFSILSWNRFFWLCISTVFGRKSSCNKIIDKIKVTWYILLVIKSITNKTNLSIN